MQVTLYGMYMALATWYHTGLQARVMLRIATLLV